MRSPRNGAADIGLGGDFILLVALLCFAVSTRSFASGVVAVTYSAVAQYREALDSARQASQGNLPVIDLSGVHSLSEALKDADPAVIIAVGKNALQAVVEAAPRTPTVYCMMFERGAPSTQYVTGVPLEITTDAQLEWIRRTAPHLKRIALLYDLRNDGALAEEAQRAAERAGIALSIKGVSDPKEIRAAAAEVARTADAIWLLPDPRLVTQETFSFLLQFTLERRIALFGFVDAFTQAGALASFSRDYSDIGRIAARLANEILARPSEKRVPVPPPVHSTGSLTINLKAAEQLGIDVSSATLSAAKRVYK